MTHRVRLNPSGRTFLVESQDTVLESGLRSGVALDFGCANGSCGRCKARIASGAVRKVRFHDFALTEAEKLRGETLLCCVSPDSDLVIEVGEAGGVADIPTQSIPSRIHRLEQVGETLLVAIRTPRSRVLRFLAGQHVHLAIEDGPRSARSLANCPCDGMNLQIHVEADPADPFAAYLFQDARKGDGILVEGPDGDFTLDESSDRPAAFIGRDTGFAPLRSLIEHAINLERSTPMRLFWQVSSPGEPYLHNLCRSWVDALDDFRYQAHSVSTGDASWPESLLRSICHDEVRAGACDFYLSGPDEFIRECNETLTRAGAEPARVRVNALERARPLPPR